MARLTQRDEDEMKQALLTRHFKLTPSEHDSIFDVMRRVIDRHIRADRQKQKN